MQAPRPRGLTVLAIVYLLTAVGIVLFWTNWFASGDYLRAGDACYRAFENSFPLPDGVLSLLLVAVSVFIFKRSHYAITGSFVAAGMLLILASLDTMYGLQHGGFSDWTRGETFERLFICTQCAALAIVTLLYLPTKYDWFLFEFLPIVRRFRIPYLVFAGILAF